MNRLWCALVSGGLLAALSSPAAAADTCEKLRGTRIGPATVVDVRELPSGEFKPQNLPGQAAAAIEVPASCRVTAVASPVAGSRIEFELWLPQKGWNHRLNMFGNGGYSSSLPYAQMANGLAAGSAVIATDTGHKGDDPAFAIGLPESISDWGHRAVHEAIVAGKILVAQYYGTAAKFTYFEGCSTGGHQALMEAQRYPLDFNGIIAGAPGNNRTRLNIGFLWQFVANHRSDGSLILPASKLGLLTQGVLRSCGSASEQRQGYLDDPLSCNFDPALLECDRTPTGDCLTGEEVAAAKRMYAGARNPRTGEQLYPPWLPGSEAGWSLYWADPRDPQQPARANFFRYWAFGDPAWDWRSFDFDRSLAQIPPTLRQKIDATDPDLSAFERAGGKLILYHGLADPVVSPLDTIAYFNRIAGSANQSRLGFARLFLVSGMGHCGGGPRGGAVQASTAIEAWTERGTAPDALPVSAANTATPAQVCHFGSAGSHCQNPAGRTAP